VQEEDPVSASTRRQPSSLFVTREPLLLRRRQERKGMNAAAEPQSKFLFTRGLLHLRTIQLGIEPSTSHKSTEPAQLLRHRTCIYGPNKTMSQTPPKPLSIQKTVGEREHRRPSIDSLSSLHAWIRKI